jgi:hypothetical protein
VTSDRVASAIEANDGCAATEGVRALEDALAVAAARGQVPEPVRREVEPLLGREFVCIELAPPAPQSQPQPQPQPQPPPAADDDDDDDHGKRGKGKKRGKKHGHDKDDD